MSARVCDAGRTRYPGSGTRLVRFFTMPSRRGSGRCRRRRRRLGSGLRRLTRRLRCRRPALCHRGPGDDVEIAARHCLTSFCRGRFTLGDVRDTGLVHESRLRWGGFG
jgi:hypothetical protein